MKDSKIVAIAGGIGSGKSVVSSVLRIMGYYVYDCDYEAKMLMNTSNLIKSDLIRAFGESCINEDGTVNSAYLATIVFNDNKALSKINNIVHPRVKDDILLKMNSCDGSVMFIETAILMQSNLLDIIDEVWLVNAPEEERIKRVMIRNGVSADDVRKRIQVQQNQDYNKLTNCNVIINDNNESLLSQIQLLIGTL